MIHDMGVATSSYNRWVLGPRTIGQQLLLIVAQLVRRSRAPSPAEHSDNSIPNTELPPCCQQQQQHTVPTNLLPLDDMPGDVCLNVLSFLQAEELCAVREMCRAFLQSADTHSEVLWEHLCRCDFPSVSLTHEERLFPHQQYIKNIISRATKEVGNLNATRHIRECFLSYSSMSSLGVIGFVSDLFIMPNPRIARAVTHKRRTAMTTVVVAKEDVIFELRRRGLFKDPLNYLPLNALLLTYPTFFAIYLRVKRVDREDGVPLLPSAPETPPPPGFLGYAIRLMQLRPEHELLRWTVLFTLFKDLAVFETTEQAEAVRARTPNGKLLYCALDHPGAQDDPRRPGGRYLLPHIGHWGFRPPLFVGGEEVQPTGASRGDGNGGNGGNGEKFVGTKMAGFNVGRLEITACFARSSLAFLQYGGGIGRHL